MPVGRNFGLFTSNPSSPYLKSAKGLRYTRHGILKHEINVDERLTAWIFLSLLKIDDQMEMLARGLRPQLRPKTATFDTFPKLFPDLAFLSAAT